MSELTAEDVLEIQGLYARYAHCFDIGAPGAAAELFTEDGTFTRANGIATSGRAELRGMGEGVSGIRHLYTNIVVESDGPDGARGSCYNLRLRIDEDGRPAIHAIGLMTDRFARTAAGWRFRSRTSTGW